MGSTILNRMKLNRSYLGGDSILGVIECVNHRGEYNYKAMEDLKALPQGTDKQPLPKSTIAAIKNCTETALAVFEGRL